MKHIFTMTKIWSLAIIVASCLACVPEIQIEQTSDPTEQQPETPEEPNTPDTPQDPEDPEAPEEPEDPETPETPENPETPEVDDSIETWSGIWANDQSKDQVGTNNDFYYELNTFTNQVIVRFNGDIATVDSSSTNIKSYVDGAYVALDMTATSGVEVIVVGKTSNGGLKIYSENKYKLTLSGVDITSQRGPAINSQSKKRVFVHLTDGTTNRLTDCASYSDDHYTPPGVYNEDRKGTFFAEGNIILSGYGALVVAGKQKHAIVTDGCFYQRPGVTVAVTEAIKNGIHVKGDSDDNTGAYIGGGAITASVTGTAGKGIKCDMDITIDGGILNISTTGDATYDSESKDTSSASGIKSDTNLFINDGDITLTSSGSGGKGISVDCNLEINGGTIDITTSGNQYRYSSSLTSSPKGIRADGNITINGGSINISVTGASEGSEGLESKNTLTFNGGETIINAYDDAINATKAININGGKVYARATNNDGIDSNGTLTINGGLLIGIGSREPEGGIDVDNNTSLVINGGIAIGVGGTMMGTPATSSTQYSVVYGGVTTSNGVKIAVLNSSNEPLFTFEAPTALSNSTLFFSTPDITNGATYTVSSGGTLSSYTDHWQGWYDGGEWSSGSSLTTFTPTSVVTTIGSVGGGPGGPGGPGGGDGGGRPGRP